MDDDLTDARYSPESAARIGLDIWSPLSAKDQASQHTVVVKAIRSKGKEKFLIFYARPS